ncbi:MAG: GatB/YqeY domain-containing protein [Oligoflexia bacterium]|nr:GatB/YqeY domain-containing protein [Oligoflexia bacterium]
MDDLKASMKNGDKLRLSVIRMVQSTLKNKEIDDRVKPEDPNDKRTPEQRDDENVLAVFKTLLKQRKDSIEQFAAGGRQDLVDQETAEMKIIESYLPQQMGREEIEKIVTEAVSSAGATSAKEMGAVMKIVMAKTQGRADGKLISELVKAKLQ